MIRVTGENAEEPGFGRRRLLKLAGAGAAATSLAAVSVRLTAGRSDRPRGDGLLVLSAQGGGDVQSLHLPLGAETLPSAGARRWQSEQLLTSTHSMVAFTWSDEDTAPRAQVRARRDGAWTSWLSVPPLVDIPDGEDTGPDRLRGTDLLWIGRADGVQIRIEGRRPRDLALVLLYPRPRSTDDLPLGYVGRPVTERSAGDSPVPRPDLVTRKEWGADESLRDGEPSYNRTLKQVHVHHTVNSNDYQRSDVPALIRGMYAYHTQTLGWSDIGYNFLVDRFGRAFVGRAGGPRRLVRGAHTLGFNAESTGVSAIGNYDTAQPTDPMLDAIAGIAAWKLAPFHRDPRGTIRVESEGSDKFAAGRVVRLPVIDGHRDTNDTACPGQHLYDALPKVRRRTARAMAAATQKPIVVEQAPSISGEAVLGDTASVDPGQYSPADAAATFQWLRDDTPIEGAQEQTHVLGPEDVGAILSCAVSLSKPAYESVVEKATMSAPVSAVPVLRVASHVRGSRVRLVISARAPAGVSDTPAGPVEILLDDRDRTVSLESGRVEARYGGQYPVGRGRHPVQVRYLGSPPFLPAEWSGWVRVE